ncbi:MAG: DeoR/GlpR transcriptional regulator [Rhodospirillaceae bacterium]|nr:DeoR/GlpR transcriptional regulator [Rhodospirillaceae bacterium]
MLAEQRRTTILDILARNGSVSVTELHRRLKVSRETVRRDISRLANENRLQKTHGGALSMDAQEPAFAERMSVNIRGKRAIGRAAAELVADGASLIIDSGTTTLCLAEALAPRRRLTIHTNDVRVAGQLSGRNDNRVFMLGGQIQGAEGAILGRDATIMLANYYCDFAFVGASAISAERGLTDYSREAAELRRLMLAQARMTVLLADKTKFDRVAPVMVSDLVGLAKLITDVKPTGAMAQALKKASVEVLVA